MSGTETGGARKDDTEKDPWHLAPWDAFLCVVKVLAFGAKKYAPRNWEKGMQWSRLYAALQRHLFAWWSRGGVDSDTGYSHLWHAGCCICFLIAYELRGKGEDDRPNDAHMRAAVAGTAVERNAKFWAAVDECAVGKVAASIKPLPRFVAPRKLIKGKTYRILEIARDNTPVHRVGETCMYTEEMTAAGSTQNYVRQSSVYEIDHAGAPAYYCFGRGGLTYVRALEQID